MLNKIFKKKLTRFWRLSVTSQTAGVFSGNRGNVRKKKFSAKLMYFAGDLGKQWKFFYRSGKISPLALENLNPF